MENIYLKRFKELGLSYPEFGEQLNVSKGSVYVFINKPERSTLRKSLIVGEALGFTEKEIREFWCAIKPAYAEKRIKENL